MDRRGFLKQAAQSASALGVSAAGSARVLGANERIHAALIGCGGRGRYVSRLMREVPGVDFIAFADAYEPHAARAREWAGSHARAFQDFRAVLDLKEVDVVVVATPDHWHAIPTVLACQAGKHVYVEKPLAHNIREGQAMVEAARRSGRIVQAGTQHRSAEHFPELARLVQSGGLGEVRFVRVWNYVNLAPDGIGTAPDSDPPPGLDWDLYLGPAPRVPFNAKRFLGTYRYFFHYAGGYITDFGVHRFDTVHQIMGVDTPLAVSAAGGRFTLKGAGDVPDLLQATFEYPGFLLSYEACNLNAHGLGGRTPGMRYYNATGPDDRPHGMAFYGTQGTIIADRIGFDLYPEVKKGGPPAPFERRWKNTPEPTTRHVRNFIECLRSRKQPDADVQTAHRATVIAHLGNIALQTGRKLRWDPQTETFPADPEAGRFLRREARKPWDLI